MLRRLLRVAVAGFCLLSLMASLGVGWLRAVARQDGRHRVRVGRDVGCYATLVRGDLALLRKPPPAGTPGEAAARALLAGTSDRHLVWRPYPYPKGPDEDRMWLASPDQIFLSLTDLSRADLLRPLFDALDDPDRFVTAHVTLAVAWGDDAGNPWPDPRVDADAALPPIHVEEYAGLRIAARMTSAADDDGDNQPTLTADPVERAEVREYWHRRLAVPAVAVPLLWVMAAFAVPPLLWLATWGRRRWVLRHRRRHGLCRRCGYDLRGSPPGGRCSECGAAAVATAAA